MANSVKKTLAQRIAESEQARAERAAQAKKQTPNTSYTASTASGQQADPLSSTSGNGAGTPPIPPKKKRGGYWKGLMGTTGLVAAGLLAAGVTGYGFITTVGVAAGFIASPTVAALGVAGLAIGAAFGINEALRATFGRSMSKPAKRNYRIMTGLGAAAGLLFAAHNADPAADMDTAPVTTGSEYTMPYCEEEEDVVTAPEETPEQDPAPVTTAPTPEPEVVEPTPEPVVEPAPATPAPEPRYTYTAEEMAEQDRITAELNMAQTRRNENSQSNNVNATNTRGTPFAECTTSVEDGRRIYECDNIQGETIPAGATVTVRDELNNIFNFNCENPSPAAEFIRNIVVPQTERATQQARQFRPNLFSGS